jgi:hypothetical protein
MGDTGGAVPSRRKRLDDIHQTLWGTTQGGAEDGHGPALSPDDHIRATRTMMTLGADPAENPIFAAVEDTALAEEYAALLIEEAEAQDEG